MFAQVIEGTVGDRDGFLALFERWQDQLRPGAAGFLGSTGGITSDGRCIVVARFESQEAAAANADRPEQSEWWADVEKCLDGAAAFTDSTDIEEFLGGGADDAGFVQVIKSKEVDRARIAALDKAFAEVAADLRPDLLGGLRVWAADTCWDVTYFTTEAEARKGEAKPPPPEMASLLEEFGELMSEAEYFDLDDPQLY